MTRSKLSLTPETQMLNQNQNAIALLPSNIMSLNSALTAGILPLQQYALDLCAGWPYGVCNYSFIMLLLLSSRPVNPAQFQ